MDATQPHVAASGTASQPSHTTSIGDAPIRAKAPPNEDPTSKEGTRAKERAQQRHQPAEAANRTHQGDERARPRQGTRPRGPGSVLPHQHPTGSTRVAATPTARAHRRNSEAVHVPPNFAQVTWLDSGVPPTFPPSLPLQAYSQMLCLYRGSGRWDLRILSTSPDAEPFLAQGIYPQVLYAPGPTRHEQWFPVGAGLVATPLGDAALASRQRWGLTSSLMPAAWLIQVDQTRRRAHGEPEIPGEVELRRGDSFLIIWEEDGWTLFERYPGDVAAGTTTVMPAGTEVSHHNHILLPEQRVHDGDVPPAQDPNASSSQARGQRSGESPPHKAAPPQPPSSSASSGNRSERAWASDDGGGQQHGDYDRTELMQRTTPQPRRGASPNKPPTHLPAAAAAPRGEAHDRSEPPATTAHPLLGAPSTQTQEEMLAVAMLVETGQADRVPWTGGRNPCTSTPEATVPEATLPSQQQPEEPGTSPSRKHRRTSQPQQRPDQEPGPMASPRHEQGQNSTATAPQQRIPAHLPPSSGQPWHEQGPDVTAAAPQQRIPAIPRTTAAQDRGQASAPSMQQAQQAPQEHETSAYMVLRAQQLITQLMPTLVGDQVPLAAEALGQLQQWSRGLWGHNVQLVEDTGPDTCNSLQETVPWNPPQPTRGTTEQAPTEPRVPSRQISGAAGQAPTELWTPAGVQSKRREERGNHGDCSLSSADMPGTETEDEAFGLTRRRRSAATGTRRRRAATEPREPGTDATCAGDAHSSHRRRRLHAVMSDD